MSPDPQPRSDPTEPWVDLDPLTGLSVVQLSGLIKALREGGVPVQFSKLRRSGLFAGKVVDVQLRVPVRLEQEARLVVVGELGVRQARR